MQITIFRENGKFPGQGSIKSIHPLLWFNQFSHLNLKERYIRVGDFNVLRSKYRICFSRPGKMKVSYA